MDLTSNITQTADLNKRSAELASDQDLTPDFVSPQSSNSTYHTQNYIDNTLRLREILKTLPPFAKDYFRAVEPTTSSKTRISYAYDIRIFFHFLMETNPVYKHYTIDQFKVDDLEKLDPVDIEEYLEYLKVYKNEDSKQITNTEKGLSRKMSALRSFYAYYFKHQYISKNPTLFVDMPKLHDKAIIRLDTDEIAMLLDYVDHGGDNLTGQRLAYYEKTKNRDLAILTLLLGTGIRVSECVGLDLNDVDFKNNGIHVTRKGGNEMVVYFGEEVANALKTYIYTTRKNTVPLSGHENALFLSTQRKRMGVQAIENMVKKYAREVTPNKKITPHKLRSTYGTSLYRETGDIYLVADVLGHKDVNTTKKHYAAIDENRRRQAATAVKLREV
nr:tyrosine-type recombinase/integrase [uncultured Mediterraneibacter sp.]